MEVKVWVEGIQRVVCGVTDKTTCQDIVFALAHATGKIGRFTLVEKWRDNESLLSPADFPLQILHKWGEYANDVQFILRHSDTKDKRKSSGRRKREKPDGLLPNVTLQDGKASSTAIKKSLTFSGVHARTDTELRLGNRLIHHAQQSSLPNGYGDHDPVMPDLVAQDSKYRLLRNGKPPNEHRTGLSPYQKQVPNYKQNYTNERSFTEHVPGVNDRVPPLERHHQTATGSPILTNGGSPHRRREPVITSAESAERAELLRLISQQENRLKDQDYRLKELSKEIECIHELDDSRYTIYVEDISKLQSNELRIHEELQDLELVSWPDKVALEKTEQNALRSELSDLKENLAQMQQKIDQRKTIDKNLMQEIKDETEKIKQTQLELKNSMDNDIKSKSSELDSLNKQNSELDKSIEACETECKGCDTSITERQLQLVNIEKDLKEFNFENFTKVPSLLTVDEKSTYAHDWTERVEVTGS